MQRAFGLDVDSDVPVPGLAPAGGPEAGRRVRLDLVDPDRIERDWSAAEAASRCVHRFADGSPMITIDEHPELGWRVWGAGLGPSVVSPDGTHVACGPPDPGHADWAPFAIGQVLPLAALLQGLEVLHASAVALGGAAVAFTGPSGSGKTSMAVSLVEAGARLVTDDVVALERSGEHVLAHPGALYASVLDGRTEPKLGRELPREDRPLPVAALFFLSGPSTAAARLAPGAQASRLVGSTFNALVTTPERQERLLDVCATLAASATVMQADGSTGEVTTLVLDELAGAGLRPAPA